jgi:truncated hemoglobin YjbI
LVVAAARIAAAAVARRCKNPTVIPKMSCGVLAAMQFVRRLSPLVIVTALASSALVSLSSCKGSNNDESSDETGGDTIYDRLGGEEGIEAAVTSLVVNRIAPDPKINAYFLNDGVDVGIVINCLTLQLGSLTGGPQEYPGADCRDMKSSHEGMGVSDADFMDLAGHLVDELTERGVAQADIDVIVEALTGMYDDIVEDPNNDATVYQRVGRKPGIQAAVADFYTIITTNPAIMAFFVDTDQTRLEACLTRQLCGIDGPCDYGSEAVALDASYGGTPCADMVSTHEGLVITIDDFGALVMDLTTALDNAGVAAADRDAILGVLGPLCAEIVSDPGTCP